MGFTVGAVITPGSQGIEICMGNNNTLTRYVNSEAFGQDRSSLPEVSGSSPSSVRQAQPRSGSVQSAEAAPGALLGIYAKTEAAQHEVVDQQTGEITKFTLNPRSQEYVEEVDPRHFRWERYALKSAVNRLLPTSRTSKCSRWRVPNAPLQVLKSQDHGKAFYTGLQVCASVWACPVCAAKISERRRAELVTAVALAKVREWPVMLLTVTVPHGLGDDLKHLLDQIHDAWRRTSTGRAGKNFRKQIGLAGTVRSLEVTYGANGFHPHLHVLLFLKNSDFSPAQVQRLFAPIWQDACVKSGLPRPSDEHGCRVDDGSRAASYASKWGLESELTKSHMKHGKQGSRTPWDFLRAFLTKSEGWEQSAHLFRTYAQTFKGRRQLYWSNGLRDSLALGEQASDEEIAAVQEDNAQYLAEITDDQWRAILFTKSETAVLDMAEQHPEALPLMLDGLVSTWHRKRTPKALPKHEACTGVLISS